MGSKERWWIAGAVLLISGWGWALSGHRSENAWRFYLTIGMLVGALACYFGGMFANSVTVLRAERLLVAKMRMMGVEPAAGGASLKCGAEC